ncbi:ribonuclease activity regulator RraA [Geminicoccaceae bacterium 1502E]|nr:ribonuclease activity regulator RraA [Geminicoccaceae bacterium 1502E]
MSELTRDGLERLAAIGTATLSMQLVKKGIRRHLIAGARPLMPGQRIAGPAFTLRFMPGREDVATPESYTAAGGLPEAVEAVPEGAVVVMESHGVLSSGLLGDILCDRLRIRGARGAVTDGAMRDMPGLRRVGWPVWCGGLTPPPSIGDLYFAGWGMPVGCGGTAVFPGDIVVADEDGAIVIPAGLAAAVLDGAVEQDAFEQWVIAEVAGGRPITGLYPPTPAAAEEYERHRQKLRG